MKRVRTDTQDYGSPGVEALMDPNNPLHVDDPRFFALARASREAKAQKRAKAEADAEAESGPNPLTRFARASMKKASRDPSDKSG